MIQSARDYLVQSMLPTTSETERELWLRTNESAQKFLEIMKSYAEEIAEEIEDNYPQNVMNDVVKEISTAIENEFDTILDSKDMRSIERIIENTIEDNIGAIQESIDEIRNQI